MAAALAALGGSGCSDRPAARIAPAVLASFEGLDVQEYSGENRTRRLRARQALLVPKRFGLLQVKATELVLTHPRYEVFLVDPADDSSGTPRGEISLAPSGLASLAGFRGVASVSLFDLECVVMRGRAPRTRITAVRGQVERGDLVLRDLELADLGSGRVLTAKRAVWSQSEHAFVIGGAYTIRGPGGASSGHAARTDLDLRLHPLRGSQSR